MEFNIPTLAETRGNKVNTHDQMLIFLLMILQNALQNLKSLETPSIFFPIKARIPKKPSGKMF